MCLRRTAVVQLVGSFIHCYSILVLFYISVQMHKSCLTVFMKLNMGDVFIGQESSPLPHLLGCTLVHPAFLIGLTDFSRNTDTSNVGSIAASSSICCLTSQRNGY